MQRAHRMSNQHSGSEVDPGEDLGEVGDEALGRDLRGVGDERGVGSGVERGVEREDPAIPPQPGDLSPPGAAPPHEPVE